MSVREGVVLDLRELTFIVSSLPSWDGSRYGRYVIGECRVLMHV